MKGVVTLEITSWAGMSFGAVHYYGSLWGQDAGKNCTHHKLEKTLTTEDARKLNIADDAVCLDLRFKWKKGNTTTRFETEDGVRNAAIETWQTVFPSAVVLLDGRYAVADPQDVLAGPDWFKEEAKRINAAWVGWDVDKERSQSLGDEWDALMERLQDSLREGT